ncbi:hypothetical protein CF327_g5219 [Tilletia walkeri]|nr:hypothetical protein CF327_g5219 [Tilletia walkeri]
MPVSHKRHPDDEEAASTSGPASGDFYIPPPKRIHLDSHPQRHGRRHRSHSASMPFNAFSRLNIAPPTTTTLHQPTPIRPTPPLKQYDISPHRTIVTSLSDDEDEDEDDNDDDNEDQASRRRNTLNNHNYHDQEEDITITSRSPSPPASAQFTLNPALAAQLAANHPFGGKPSTTSPIAPPLPTIHHPSTSPDSAGALILYKPVTPKAAYVRPEDEEREDEDDDDSPSTVRADASLKEDEPLIEEIDEESPILRSQSRRSTRPTLPPSSSSSSSLRIIELENDMEDEMRDEEGGAESEDLIYPSYYVESPSSPGYSTASTATSTASSAHSHQHHLPQRSVIDLSQQYQPSSMNAPMFAPGGVGGGAEHSSFSPTPMSISTTGSNTPVSYTPSLLPNLTTNQSAGGSSFIPQGPFVGGLTTEGEGGDEDAPMDLD